MNYFSGYESAFEISDIRICYINVLQSHLLALLNANFVCSFNSIFCFVI